MRFLLRLILADPALLFTSVVVTIVVAAVVAIGLSVRRARALAELSDDPSLASGQRRQLVAVIGVTLGVIGLAAWWSFFRIHTELDKVAIAIAVEGPDGPVQWWQGDDGADQLAREIGEQLSEVGLEPVARDGSTREVWAEIDAADPDAVIRAARSLEARWLIRGRVHIATTIELELADFSDYVTQIELEIVDTQTGEVFPVPGLPMRMFLWGETLSDAVSLNAKYAARRTAMPLIAALAAQAPLREYAGKDPSRTTEEAMLAASLERLFVRADRIDEGLEQRAGDEAKASAAEPVNHAAIAQARISGVLDEEYFIGSAADGRVLLLSDPKHISLVPDQLRYEISSEGEVLVLADRTGEARSPLLEHYNFYSAPAISADGRVVWTTVANHGASKTLATIDVETGSFAPVLSHQSHYYTSPLPSPDGSRALFYSRAERYAETSIELISRDGSGRQTIVPEDEQAGLPAWAPEGRSAYIPVGGWARIVEYDFDRAQARHILGSDPDAPIEPDTDTDSDNDNDNDDDDDDDDDSDDDDDDDDDDDSDDDDDDDDSEPDSDFTPPTPDPRQAIDFAHHGSRSGPEQPDPATSSRFTGVTVSHDGRGLYVVEQSVDGRHWLGYLDLDALELAEKARAEGAQNPNTDPDASPDATPEDAPAPAYRRLAQVEVDRLSASPVAPIVAFEAPAFTAPGDVETRDQEILLFGPEPGQLRALTLNDVDDELAGWSRDGQSIFTIQRGRDPGSDRHPVTRVYRHDLPR